MNSLETHLFKFSIQKLIPDMSSLFKSIDGFQEANYLPSILSNPLREVHVQLFIQFTIEECCVNIQVMEVKFEAYCKGTQNTDGGELDYWSKCFIKIKARYLREALSNQSSLVAFYGTIPKSLELEDQTQTNCFPSR
jgi:hypothetical protein